MPSKQAEEQRVWLYDALKLMLPDTGAAIMISGLLAPKLAERERQVRLDEAKWWAGHATIKDLLCRERIAALECGECPECGFIEQHLASCSKRSTR